MWLGIVGVSLILIAFGFTLTKRWSSDMPIYLITNIVGCTLTTTYDALYLGFSPFFFLQATWGIFSVIKLISVLRKKAV